MKAIKISLLLIVGILSLVVWSCVDVPTEGALPPDYHALARYVHVATDAGTGSVTVDGASVGSLSFGQSTEYLDLLAGGRNLDFASTTQKVVFRSKSQNTVLVYALSGSNRFLKLDEGYYDKNPFAGGANNAQIQFVHVGQGSFPTLEFREDSKSGAILQSDVPYATGTAYANVDAGSHTIYVVSNGGYSATINGSQGSPPNDSRTKGTADVYVTVSNDSLSYTVSMKCDVKDSFYFAAHFHYGAAGTAGSVFLPIDITGQVITFPDVVLEGSNAVPPVNTTASGSGKFTLYRDSLTYEITAVRDTFGNMFTASHFHNAPAGQAGPVVYPISGPVGDTVLSGSWTKNSIPPLTPALITELLAGRIYLNFHSAANALGEIRAQLIPDSLSSNEFSGTMTDIGAVKDSLNIGHVYVNFHNAVSPNGHVRGQVAPDPDDGGQYGVASMPATTFEAGRMYTVVASGAYNNLGLLLLSDRQFGLAKTAPTLRPKAAQGSSK
jgi:hypothetical protein